MARIKLPNELKKAISEMPDREKDKLLFRLVAKDAALVEQLNFRLLENGETTEERRDDLKDYMERFFRNIAPHYYSPGYLLLEMRYLSGRINDHVKTTKDKYGEIELNIFLLTRTLELFGHKTKNASLRRASTFNTYTVKRTLKILKLIEKMHEDYALDFQENMNKLMELIRTQPTMINEAKSLELEV